MESVFLDLIKTTGLGLLTGFVLAIIAKKVSKLLFFVVALLLILVQIFGFNELLNIDWLAIKDQTKSIIAEKIPEYKDKANIFLANLPFTIGLIIAFLFGIRK